MVRGAIARLDDQSERSDRLDAIARPLETNAELGTNPATQLEMDLWRHAQRPTTITARLEIGLEAPGLPFP